MSHDEASELLGAYALDAVDGEELTALEVHLETCPRCRAELDSLHEVAGAIGTSVEPLPDGLWSSIASPAPRAPRWTRTPPPVPRRLTPEAPVPLPASARPAAAPPARRGRHPRRHRPIAAAAVAVVLGIGLVRLPTTTVSGTAGRRRGSPGVHRGRRLADPGAPARRARRAVARAGSRSSWCCPTERESCLVSSRGPAEAAAATRDLPAVGGSRRARPVSLRPPRRCAAEPSPCSPDRPVRTGRRTSSVAARARRGFGDPHGSDRRHGNCLRPAGSC